MKVSDYIVNKLIEHDIKDFGLVYGSAIADLVDSIAKNKNCKYYCFFHEQALGFAAEGFIKVAGPKFCGIVTSGPGFGNLLTCLQNLFYDSVPGIFITGQVNSKFLRTDPNIRQQGFQECDTVSIAKPITKYVVEIKSKESIRYELEKCLYLMNTGRPGPCLISLPLDIAKEDINPKDLLGFTYLPWECRKTVVFEQINKYINDLKQSVRPSLLVGGGVRSARAINNLNRVCKILKIPVFTTWNALDIVCFDNEYWGGCVGTYSGRGRNFGIQNTDLLLCVGTRISGRITGGIPETFARGAKKYLVDIDEALLQPKNQHVKIDENIYCNVKEFLYYLGILAEHHDYSNFSSWLNRCKYWKDKYDPVKPEFYEQTNPVHPYVFVRELSKLMTKEDILVADCGGNIVVTNHSFDTKTGQRYFTNNGNSPMGFSQMGCLGAELAARRLNKHCNVVCIIGDGGCMMNLQDWQTLVNYNIKIKTFILNNHCYGITRCYQQSNNFAEVACNTSDYIPPNFVKLANAFGIRPFNIDSNKVSDIHNLIKEVLDYNGPAIINVDCGDYCSYYPRVGAWNQPIEDQSPHLPRSEFFENMIVEPTEYSKNLKV